MLIIRSRKKRESPLSLSRTILFSWFIFAFLVGILSVGRLFILGEDLPEDASILYDYITYLAGVWVGGYGVSKGVAMHGNGLRSGERRERSENNESD